MKKISKIEHNYDVDQMNPFTLARWIALMEGVNSVADKADDRGIALKKINFKQPAMSKYVESTCDIIARNIMRDNENA